MPYLLVQEILEELIPANKRGEACRSFEFQSGRNFYSLAVYLSVSIEMDINNSTADESTATVGQAIVKFESAGCKVPNNQIDLQN